MRRGLALAALAAAGPNFARFDDGVLYELNVDSDGDTQEEVADFDTHSIVIQVLNNVLGDGADANEKPFLTTFPYVAAPHQGADHSHHAS